MTIDSLFNKVIDKERSDLIASNPNKDMPPLKDFNDLLKCEKQADQQLEIIKEFVENFTSFMNTLCTTPATRSRRYSPETPHVYYTSSQQCCSQGGTSCENVDQPTKAVGTSAAAGGWQKEPAAGTLRAVCWFRVPTAGASSEYSSLHLKQAAASF